MVARLVPLSVAKIEKKLRNLGFVLDHEDGSIRFYIREKEGRMYVVQVHYHPGDKGLDVITAILRTGGITRSEWENA